MSQPPSSTIIILVKNGARYLAELLDAVFSQRDAAAFEVLTIDSGSTDNSLAILRRFPVRLQQIEPLTFNHGGTRNLGAELAGPEVRFLVYLTQDATPATDHWLANLLTPMETDPLVAGVFSRHIPRPGASPALARQLLTVWQTGGRERIVKEMPGDPAQYERERLHYVYFSNTSSALRRTAWEGVPFRQVDFAEDADWADRALQAGYRLVFEPGSAVLHSHDYPILEQFRQNADHTAGMRKILPASVPRGWQSIARQVGGIPLQVLADWRYTWTTEPFSRQPARRKIAWMLHSPCWHVASVLGTLAGAEMHRLPAALRRSLSHQERLRTHTA